MGEEEENDVIASAFSTEAILEAVSRAVALTYEKCSLCGNIIEGEIEHVLREHPHLEHIQAMVAKPIPPLSACESYGAAAMDLGSFAVATSSKADRGEAAFRVVHRAQAQLHRLLSGMHGFEGHVYPFGSIVSMGSWDGIGDGDFSFVCPELCFAPPQYEQAVVPEEAVEQDSDDETMTEGKKGYEVQESSASGEADTTGAVAATALRPIDLAETVESADMEKVQSSMQPLCDEKGIIHKIAARLRGAGFRFEELDLVLRTRIPVVRRKRAKQEPPPLNPVPQASLICIRFDTAGVENKFRKERLNHLIYIYKATEILSRGRQQGRSLVLSVPDSTDAIHLMAQRERIRGVRKEWLDNHRSPEIFSIDFDISCRHHGIRNSWLLRRYFAQNEVFRVGNVFLKMWSKACGVNNSRVGFLTSYSISLLWIYFLLRRGEAAFVNPADIPELPNGEEQMEVSYIPLWPAVANAKANADRTSRLGGLLQGFFYFYGEEFCWDTHVVTIRKPYDSATAIPTKEDLGWDKSDTLSLVLRDRCYHIFSIEDVYEEDLDLGRHLTPNKAAWARLQFRLAYRQCCTTWHAGPDAGASPLWQLFDTPRKRAEDVLRARLYAYLLRNTKDAAAPIANILEQLCVSNESNAGNVSAEEDPMYLPCAYELGNRVCDLWFDNAQVEQDIAFHKMYIRRNTDYTPPANPMMHGEWAAVCTDDLQEHHDPKYAHQQRSVRLAPPVRKGSDTTASNLQAMCASSHERTMQLVTSRRQYEECVLMLRKHPMIPKQPPAAVVGVSLKDHEGTLYPHCFYPLQGHRLFGTYEARATFIRCVGDVVEELARLRGNNAPRELEQGGNVLHNRKNLLLHLKKQLCPSTVATDPTYTAVLKFICLPTEPYIQATQLQPQGKEPPTLCPTPLLLSLANRNSSGFSVAAKPKVSRTPPPLHL
ncbi:putative Cid1 family poly A polymerase [Leishmania naiffi]|uniref:RNA uridylyltransferase n=1 Tax=Leishmania naiffi TaxID=5678 RepID=A0AAW3BW56_9TRYP